MRATSVIRNARLAVCQTVNMVRFNMHSVAWVPETETNMTSTLSDRPTP